MKEKLYRLILPVISIFFQQFSTYSGAQTLDPVFQQFTVKDGLPSSEVYYVFQDSRGYLWFATDNGISSYNGDKFQNYTLRDGLADNVVFKIFEDSAGRVWFGTYSCKLSYFFNDSIYSFIHNTCLSEKLPNNPVLNSFHVAKNGDIYLGLTDNGCIKISQNGIIEHLNPDTIAYGKGHASYYLLEIESKLLAYRSKSMPSSPLETISLLKEGKTLKSNFQLDPKDITRSNICPLLSSKKKKYIAISNSMIIVDEIFQETTIKKRNEILSFYEDNDNTIWIGYYKGGVEKLDGNANSFSFLQGLSVSSVLQDHEGGYWFSTLENGVFYVPALSIRQFSISSGFSNIPANVICNGGRKNIYIGLQNGSVCILSESDYELQGTVRIGPVNNTFQILDLLYENPSKLLVGTVGDIIRTKYSKQLFKNLEIIPLPCPKLISQNQEIWGGSSLGISKFNQQRLEYNSAESGSIIRVNCFVNDTLNSFWTGNKKGLWRFQSGKFDYWGTRHPLLQFAVNDIVKNDERLFLATDGAGLVIMDRDTVYNFYHKEGLYTESINSVYIGNDGVIWLATPEGLTSLFDNGNSIAVKNVSETLGLSKHEVSDVEVRGDDILIAGKNGFMAIKNYNATGNAIEIPIYITNIQVDHTDTYIQKNYDLPHNKNYIRIDYKAISYRYGNVLEYKYRMAGLDSAWHKTQSKSVQYASLSPGNYLFEVTVAGYPEFKHKIASVNFVIHPPYYKTWWFILLITVASASLISLAVYMRIRQIISKGRLLQELNETQQKALSAQMNPHFIFNSLNSIHTYILQNKTEDSSKYLAKFARLMRMVLDNSREHLITISEEIKALELYLELEVMRFKGKISYTIHIDDAINTEETKIPPLLLQPYVENAIWHGLMYKEDNGAIEIELQKERDKLTCFVRDNGIGRARSSELKPGKKSVGTSITEKRVRLINSVHNIRIGVTINNLLDQNQSPVGTEVKIVFPILL